MPENLIAVGAELVLTITCLAIALELSIARKAVLKLGAICVLIVGLAALLGALRYTGVNVASYHIWVSEIAGFFGVAGFYTLLAGNIKRDGYPLYLLLLVSVFGYALQIAWLKDAVIITALLIQGISLFQQRIPAYHFVGAFVAILAAGGFALAGMQPASWQEAVFHVLLAFSLHQYFRQYTQRPGER